ncbi:hypothetical protein TIFTF001_022666 [Ficus carica]|uniref:Activator of Hsp90 ATPase AHSA1-like N-terminal domain-containing protein n=1 Tax=Ficus carica TaxID=3494 RepID=A0AA88AMB3_FICCA|nr:hypothetical protein TIFTF001_022666 [Ficus carica]
MEGGDVRVPKRQQEEGEEGEQGEEGKAQGKESTEEEETTSSYRYWVRGSTEDAVPLPPPKKLSADDLLHHNPPPTFGSLWNRELIMSVGWLEFPGGGKAHISDVSKCVGDAFLVTVRNKKRVGYTYELTFKVNDFTITCFIIHDSSGEWIIKDEKKSVKAHLDVPELSFGELHDLHQLEVKLSEEKDVSHQDKLRIIQDLKQFLEPVREKLLQFEQELKDR